MNGTRSQSLTDVELGFEPTSVQSMYPHCPSAASREGKGIEGGGGAVRHEEKEPGIWHTVGLQPGSRSAGRKEMEVVGVGHSSETLAKNENWGKGQPGGIEGVFQSSHPGLVFPLGRKRRRRH